jgi:uncharacterized protein DUF2460
MAVWYHSGITAVSNRKKVKLVSNLVYPALVKGLTYTVLKTPNFATIVQAAPSGEEVRIAVMRNPLWSFTLIYDYIYDNFNSPNNTQAYAPYTDLQALMGFFLGRQGGFDDFLFSDPDDHTVSGAMPLVNDGAGTYYTPLQRNLGGFLEDVTDVTGLSVSANGVLQTEGTLFNYTLGGPGVAIPGYSYLGLYVKWNAPAPWVGPYPYTLGLEILDPAGHIQKVTTAGTSGTTAPAPWNDTAGTTTDGTVTWTDQGYNPGPTPPITAAFSFYFRVRFDGDTQDFEKWAAGLWTIGGSNSQNGSGTLKLKTARF